MLTCVSVTASPAPVSYTHLDVYKRQMHGDVAFDEVEPSVAAITPVPGGVGAVTSTVLALHVAQAACRSLEQRRS